MHRVSLKLDRAACPQLGLITTGQMRQIGLSQRQIEWRAANGSIIPIRHLVYRMAGSPVNWERVVLAAILGARATAVASHTTAAAIWQLRHSDRDTAGLHVTADRRVQMKGVTCHLGRITPQERTEHRGIPVTTPERTIMDLAGTLTARQLGECIDDAMRRGLIHLPRFRVLVERAAASKHGRRLLAPLHQVLADRITGYRPDDSDFEKRMNAEWDRLRLPPAQRQYRVRCGNKTYRLDVAIPDNKIGIEWESLEHHGTRSGIDNDSDRRADLAAEGWVIQSFTWSTSPERIARAVFRLWKDRGGQVAPPGEP
ncbi:MAG: hypothetical protein QOG97_1962 [Acidimicrobiaceae bacterium]|nr:hypothetical protein [Acidimicrobiaceae bacterium]